MPLITPDSLPEGWRNVSSDERTLLIDELLKEVATNHILYERNLNAIAKRDDNDDRPVSGNWQSSRTI